MVSKEAITGYLKQYPDILEANIDLGNDQSEGSAIAINKTDDTSLVDAINEVLSKLEKENKIEAFVEKATQLAQ